MQTPRRVMALRRRAFGPCPAPARVVQQNSHEANDSRPVGSIRVWSV